MVICTGTTLHRDLVAADVRAAQTNTEEIEVFMGGLPEQLRRLRPRAGSTFITKQDSRRVQITGRKLQELGYASGYA